MTGDAGLLYLLGDHLGSTTMAANPDGTLNSKQLYMPFGESRYTSGSLPTDYIFTGQMEEPELGLYYYNTRYYDPYITQFTQPDTIIPDPTNPLDFNRYSYARYNPIRFNDPTGHYVCTGSNEKWGEKTCYDIVNNWLDYLYKQGGDEGKSLVEQFIKADAQYTIRIDFLDPSKMNGALAQAVNLYNKINVSINSGIDKDNIGIEAAILGHELVHLTRQSSIEQGTAQAEKEAYDVSVKLHKNMGLDPFPIFNYIEPLGYSGEDLKKVAEYTGTSEKPNVVNYLSNPLARTLIVSWESLTGCYGSVCFAPGAQPYQYNVPSK